MLTAEPPASSIDYSPALLPLTHSEVQSFLDHFPVVTFRPATLKAEQAHALLPPPPPGAIAAASLPPSSSSLSSSSPLLAASIHAPRVSPFSARDHLLVSLSTRSFESIRNIRIRVQVAVDRASLVDHTKLIEDDTTDVPTSKRRVGELTWRIITLDGPRPSAEGEEDRPVCLLLPDGPEGTPSPLFRKASRSSSLDPFTMDGVELGMDDDHKKAALDGKQPRLSVAISQPGDWDIEISDLTTQQSPLHTQPQAHSLSNADDPTQINGNRRVTFVIPFTVFHAGETNNYLLFC